MKYLIIITIVITFFPAILFSKIINGEAKYRFGDNETVIQAKKKCKIEALRNAVETYAIYIESKTIITDYKLSKDIIIAKAIALVKEIKINEEKIDRLNSIVYCNISGEINEKEVLKTLHEQSNDNRKNIKFSGNYYFGEGLNSDLRKADQQAIRNLVTDIANDLQNKFAAIKPQDQNQYDFTESIINTYKNSFNKYEKKIDIDNGRNSVLRYIKKSDLKKIFNPRKKKIKDYLSMAQRAESELRIGDALRYYYWTLSLLRTHPEHNQIIVPFFDKKLLLLALPEKINYILTNLSFYVSSIKNKKNNKQVFINIQYKEMNIQNIDYKYYLGDGWSVITNGKNGLALCEFNGAFSKSMKKIKLNIEYRYKGKNKIDPELKTVIESVNPLYFPSSSFEIDLKNRKKI